MADEIDPRYAPQFQRGFDATQHVTPPARRGPVRLAGGPPPTAQRVPEPPPLTHAPEAAELDAEDAATPEQPSERSLLTWWDWLLPAVGAGLILIALLLWSRLATDTSVYFGSGTSDQWEIFWQQAGYTLAGPFLSAGILAVAGGLVLQAVRPRR